MPRYAIRAWVKPLDAEVEADDDDDALADAIAKWSANADAILAGATFEVREVDGG